MSTLLLIRPFAGGQVVDSQGNRDGEYGDCDSHHIREHSRHIHDYC